MTKPVIVTRASKGSGITAAEMDANFNNINDAVITVTGDTGSITNSLNESFQISGGVATTSKVIDNALIIDLDNTSVTPGSYTAADITVDAQGRITAAANGSGGSSFDPASPGAIGSTTASTGSFTSLTATGVANSPKLLLDATALSSTAWTSNGIGLRVLGATYTDTSSAAGTVSSSHVNYMGASLLASTNAITVTHAATLSIGGAPVESTNTTITNKWGISCGGGARIFGGPLQFTETREPIYDIGTTGGTIAPNAANGTVQKITLNSALTLNAFTTPVAGQSITLFIYGGTAYTSITSTMKFAGGVKTLTATAGCIDILTVYYDGTTYFASLGKGYA